MRFPWTRLQRILATVALGLAFIVMASIFVPFESTAQDSDVTIPRSMTPGQDRVESTDPHEGLGSLGRLERNCYHVHIYATDLGPRYSVYDAASGKELAVLLTAERVAALFPELPLPSMEFGAPIQLMHVDPMNSDWRQ